MSRDYRDMRTNSLIAGNNIDKKIEDRVRRYINRDKDINRFIRLGQLGFIKEIMLTLIAAVVVTLSVKSIIAEIYTNVWIERVDIIDFMIQRDFIIRVIVIVLFLFNIIQTIRDFIDLSGNLTEIPKYLHYLFDSQRPQFPTDIWSVYQGSVVDNQLHNTLESLNEEVEGTSNWKFFYAGEPYYCLFFIDSIYLKWTNNAAGNFLSRRYTFKRLYSKLARNCTIAHVEKRFFNPNRKRRECSSAVFGILFSSTYFKYYYNEIVANRKNGKFRVCIKDVDNRNLIYEILCYCIRKDLIEVVEECDNPDFIVTGVSYTKSFDEGFHSRKSNAGECRIPFKRFIAIEREAGKDITTSLSFQTFTQHMPIPTGAFSSPESRIIIVGGAEQNYALQRYINCYRGFRGLSTPVVGFSENAFDVDLGCDLLVGAEGLAYVLKESFEGRLVGKDVSREAYLYNMKINIKGQESCTVTNIYGLSSMMTKISLLAFVYANKTGKSDYLPGSRKEIVDVIRYVVPVKDEKMLVDDTVETISKIYETSFGKKWDKGDLMNNKESMNEAMKTFLGVE